MSVKYLSRRQLLVGAAGFGLALPFLRSILPRELAAAPGPDERRFVAFASNHGGIFESAMYPGDSLFTEESSPFLGHTVRRGDLSLMVEAGEARVSDILRAHSERFTPTLLGKMNVLRGLDIPFYIAHHTGGHLGNYARNDGNGADGEQAQAYGMPTIDQIMAWSGSFYETLSGVTERAMVFGPHRLSYNWTSPSDRSGAVQQVNGDSDPRLMFNKVFVPEEDPDAPEPRPLIVDRVNESYQSLRQSNRRLSSEDKQRLDDHMDRLSELERKLNNNAARRVACGDAPTLSGDTENPREYYGMVNDVITTAFLCGTSRIAVVKVQEERFSDYAGDWHQDIAHQWSSAEPQARLQEVNQQVFEHVMVDLAHKLDVEEAPGMNILDSSLIQWTQESGETTHDARSLPLVTFGGAGGRLPVGQYCDYRKRTDAGMAIQWGSEMGYTGLLYSQWLSQVLQLMGVPVSEFANIQNNAASGYGYGLIDEVYGPTHSDGLVDGAHDPLPFLSQPG